MSIELVDYYVIDIETDQNSNY